MKTFKQMIKCGDVRRADAMKVLLDDIHEQPGFNLRAEGADLDASIDELSAFIQAGGRVPPLECRPREEGGVWVVDGHRRRRALIKARAAGVPVEWVSIVAFEGSDVDRIARVITSAEGRKLTPLEAAAGVLRLRALDLTVEEIAAKLNKSAQTVNKLLTLGQAPVRVQRMVAAGEVSATTATAVTKTHGDRAAEVLADELDRAKDAGKDKVTPRAMQGGKTIKAVARELVASVGNTDGNRRMVSVDADLFESLKAIVA